MANVHWPFLRPMLAWLELAIADIHEYAEMMNRSISDDALKRMKGACKVSKQTIAMVGGDQHCESLASSVMSQFSVQEYLQL